MCPVSAASWSPLWKQRRDRWAGERDERRGTGVGRRGGTRVTMRPATPRHRVFAAAFRFDGPGPEQAGTLNASSLLPQLSASARAHPLHTKHLTRAPVPCPNLRRRSQTNQCSRLGQPLTQPTQFAKMRWGPNNTSKSADQLFERNMDIRTSSNHIADEDHQLGGPSGRRTSPCRPTLGADRVTVPADGAVIG